MTASGEGGLHSRAFSRGLAQLWAHAEVLFYFTLKKINSGIHIPYNVHIFKVCHSVAFSAVTDV